MKSVGKFIKATLIGGLLVVLPIGLLVAMFAKGVVMLKGFLHPIVEDLPSNLHFPNLIAIVFLFAICFLMGLLTQTSRGQSAGKYIERSILNRLPGYTLLRTVIRRIGNVDEGTQFAPALVEIEDALVPAFVVEVHSDRRCTIFVPSAPTPGVGAIYIIDKSRVHLLDSPLLKTVSCITQWGVGGEALLATMRPADPGTSLKAV